MLELKAFPSGMEMFPSADDEQWEFIKREIDSSDYYVLVVAGKYGSVAPDGVSYTEKEYDHALGQKKPVHSLFAPKSQKANLSGSTATLTNSRHKYSKHSSTLSISGRRKDGSEQGTRVASKTSNRLRNFRRKFCALEAEVAELRRDPTERLAQGRDTIERVFPLLRTSDGIRSTH
jgi:hypothetical protein